MRRLTTLVVVAVVAVSCAPTVNVEQEKTALLAVDADWEKSVADLDKFMSFVAPDATMMMAGAPPVKGDKAIRETFGGLTKIPGFALTWKATQADVAASGDLGYTSGDYSLTANNAAGKPATEKGTFITTWKKINGAWKVVVDAPTASSPPAVSSPHIVVPVASVKWMDAPPFLAKGAKLAVVLGDPSQAAPFTLRLQMPDGYKIAPHTHPTDEHVTVLSGVLRAGMGEKWDDGALGDLAAGSYANLAAAMPHFVTAKGATVVQVHGMGPFVLNYVNPADDPSKTK
jgi:ketosteroid isomerase-like protein/quercetin dioxygenase-like cupin family protein